VVLECLAIAGVLSRPQSGMKAPLPILIATTGLLVSSCATSMLWEKTNPHEYVVVTRTAEVEAGLRKKNARYRVDEERNLLYVEKSAFRKTHDYMTRFFVTPVAVAHDIALGAAVVGAAAYIAGETGEPGVDLGAAEAQNRELDRLERLMRNVEESEKARRVGGGSAEP